MQKDCLAEMLRVLKPGGRLVLVDFSGPGPLLHRVGALFRSHEHEHERSDGLTQCLLQLGFEQPARHPMNPSYLFCLIAKKPSLAQIAEDERK
jgi:ubiquinone/menaquinone biosynthesis C-methylase UbiE